jgi:tRNA dimethylallyltransferase
MKPLLILSGQTASGKAAVAVRVAGLTNAELISVDSMKVYRGLDIGTGKPTRAIRESVPFHLLDVVDPNESFSLASYLDRARAALEEIHARGRPALFVGGTPLYLRGLLYGIFEGPAADWALRGELMKRAQESGPEVLHEELRKLDPTTADRLHPRDLTRVIRALEVMRVSGRPISSHQRQYPAGRKAGEPGPAPSVAHRMVALRRSDADLKERIHRRVARMFAAGLLDEVRRVLEGPGFSRSAQKAIGYREAIEHLKGVRPLDETVELIERNTWRMARKQRAWLKSFPAVQWLDVAADEPAETTAEKVRRLLFAPECLN